jgi:diguanylate cyclase (GGDEF)-like protein
MTTAAPASVETPNTYDYLNVKSLLSDDEQQIQEQQQKLQEANLQLQALATTDGLTGLKNHRTFKERLDEEFQRAARYQLPLSLVLLDVDRFKEFNDNFGHPAGDEVLKSVARLLRENTRNTDIVARYGGEEFVVLLLNNDRADALILAERLRQAIESAPWKQREVTASCGVSSLTLGTHTSAELIATADIALYHSKQNGRNRVTHVMDLSKEAVLADRSSDEGVFRQSPLA